MKARSHLLRLFSFRTLRARMLFWILCVAVPIYSVSSWMSYRAAAVRLEAQAERDADELVSRIAAGLDAVIRPIEGGIRTVAAALEEVDPPRELYALRIRGVLAAWPDVYGSTIAAEKELGPFAPYYFRGKAGMEYADLAKDSYGYQKSPWYRRAADSRQPVWSAPYFDAGGGETWMVTYSVPFFRRNAGQRTLAGVVTADLELNWVKATAAAVQLGPAGVAWIFSPPGQLPFVAPIGSTLERIGKHVGLPPQSFIRENGERLYETHIPFALVADPASGEAIYLVVRNLETLNWRLVLAIPRAELLADARALLHRQMLLGAAGLAGLFAAILLVAAGISRPIRALARSVGGVRSEEFEFLLPTDIREDEVGVLTEALRRMRDSLQRHIQLRSESLAVEKKLEHELAFAATIQQSMLPTYDSVALPEWAQVRAALLPAKRVGGDLFDYFTIRDGGLLFAVGDVSDKGIPAALCMARLSSLLRLLGTTADAPNHVLRDVNLRFSERNEACMFATVACAMLDGHTGRLRYASAGHELPLLREAGGRVLQLDAANGPAIGIEMQADYPLAERYLAPGDTLILFTDGVTEAVADDGTLFGIDRLMQLLGDVPASLTSADLVRHITDTVTVRAARFHATDDLTVLTVTFSPPCVSASRTESGTRWVVETPTTERGVGQTKRYLQAILAARGISAAQIGDAELIAEELLTNVAKGVSTATSPVRLSLDCELTLHEIVLTVRDDGLPFDPLARASPDLDADIADRPIGGLGIHIVRELVAACRYERTSAFNVLEIRLHRTL